uniref:C2H2-type domain-containing protein n=1 Tax=Timema bartmani TaxID=61472 RepID=A0A7R9EYI8_9NEOP|nr:unnamed protein product [Timema bartmani]
MTDIAKCHYDHPAKRKFNESPVNNTLCIQNYLEPNKLSNYVKRNAIFSFDEEFFSIVKQEHGIQVGETNYEFPENASEEEKDYKFTVTNSIGSVCDSSSVVNKEIYQNMNDSKDVNFLIEIDTKTELNVNNLNICLNTVNEVSNKDTRMVPMPQQAPTSSIVMSSEEEEDFYCHICETYFPDNLMLTSHNNTSHITVKLKCQFCDIQFENSNQLNEHKKIHSNIFIECPVCSKMVHKVTGLKKHFSLHRDLNLHVCFICGQVLPNETELKSHKFLHHKEKNHLCETCGKAFKYKFCLSNHMKTHLGDVHRQKFKCGFCGLCISNRVNLKHHIATHNISRERKYSCDLCEKKFFYRYNLTAHIPVHFEDRPFKCTSCDKAFKWKKNLDLHLKTHLIITDESNNVGLKSIKSKTPQLLCQICGKTLLSKMSLYMHMKRHEGNLKFICEICGKTLCDPQTISAHLNYHTKRFECSFCGKNLSSKMSRDNHEMTHTGEKPFSCRFCERSVRTKNHLTAHEDTHLDKRPFICAQCPKTFRRRSHLRIHFRTHTGEKPYLCKICSRGFAQSGDMNSHMFTHSQERPFVCECGVSFRQKRNLEKHKKNHLEEN